jgi:hypothetical protein
MKIFNKKYDSFKCTVLFIHIDRVTRFVTIFFNNFHAYRYKISCNEDTRLWYETCRTTIQDIILKQHVLNIKVIIFKKHPHPQFFIPFTFIIIKLKFIKYFISIFLKIYYKLRTSYFILKRKYHTTYFHQ